MFLEARNPTVLLEILFDVTGSQKSKMAASNLEIRLSRLVDMIAMKFQWLPPCFWSKVSNGTIGNTVRRNRKSEIKDGGLQSGNTYISTSRHDSNEMPTATRLAIDVILNHTVASPHTSSTIATASVAKCAMCISESTSYPTGKANE